MILGRSPNTQHALHHVIVLDPQNGFRLWEYDSPVDASQSYSEVTSRGVSA